MNITQFARRDMERQIKEHEKKIETLKKGIKNLDNINEGRSPRYKVTLMSCEGENDVELMGSKPLKEIFDRAHAIYLEVNCRSDVNVIYRVLMMIPPGIEIYVPEVFWAQYKYCNPQPALL
jgi:hypothetical protein